MLGPFVYKLWHGYEAWADGVRFRFDDDLLVEVFGATQQGVHGNIGLCERERPRIEAACRKAQARTPGQSELKLCKTDFVNSTDGVRLVLSFPDSKTAQQFSGWVYSAGYPERTVSQNVVTVVVLRRERDRVTQEARDRHGRMVEG